MDCRYLTLPYITLPYLTFGVTATVFATVSVEACQLTNTRALMFSLTVQLCISNGIWLLKTYWFDIIKKCRCRWIYVDCGWSNLSTTMANVPLMGCHGSSSAIYTCIGAVRCLFSNDKYVLWNMVSLHSRVHSVHIITIIMHVFDFLPCSAHTG